MATNIDFDLNAWFASAQEQFSGLNPNEPGQWPWLPKAAAFLAVCLAALGLGWFLLISDQVDQLEAAREREPVLKADYKDKLAQAVNLPELRKQRIQVEEYVTQLEKQLPGKAEMDKLLSDINQAGLGRGLEFELFKPGQVAIKDYYAELPISIKVSGSYHDFGAFVSDIANLSRIVTLHDLNIALPARDATGALVMEATARTYRYLDPAELQSMAEAKQKDKSKKNKGASAGEENKK